MTEEALVADDAVEETPSVPEGQSNPEENTPEPPTETVPEGVTVGPDGEYEFKGYDPGFDPIQQAFINKHVVGKATKDRTNALKETERLRAEFEELQAKIPPETAPEIPAMPDPFDDDYDQQVKARDDAIQKRAEWDAAQRLQVQREQEQAQMAEQLRIQEQTKKTEEFVKRSGDLGIEQQELAQAMQAVGQIGLDIQVAEFIVGDPNGPELTVYLGNNPMEVENLRSMNPMQAAVHLHGLKEKARRKAPETPPAPTEEPAGMGGFKPTAGPEGATYE